MNDPRNTSCHGRMHVLTVGSPCVHLGDVQHGGGLLVRAAGACSLRVRLEQATPASMELHLLNYVSASITDVMPTHGACVVALLR